jgi:hypothetical protein
MKQIIDTTSADADESSSNTADGVVNVPSVVQHSCGETYDPSLWFDCPACLAESSGAYALECADCLTAVLSFDDTHECPECGSTDMDVKGTPSV